MMTLATATPPVRAKSARTPPSSASETTFTRVVGLGSAGSSRRVKATLTPILAARMSAAPRPCRVPVRPSTSKSVVTRPLKLIFFGPNATTIAPGQEPSSACGSSTAPGMQVAMRGTLAKRRMTSVALPGTLNSPSKCIGSGDRAQQRRLAFKPEMHLGIGVGRVRWRDAGVDQIKPAFAQAFGNSAANLPRGREFDAVATEGFGEGHEVGGLPLRKLLVEALGDKLVDLGAVAGIVPNHQHHLHLVAGDGFQFLK